MNKDLYSKYWDDLNKGRVLPEYPRPQFARDSYLNLNGYWDYRISKKADIPEYYDGRIIVPFTLESLLSEATRSLQPDEYLIYHRLFTVS